MLDPRTGIDMIPQVLYNWGSEFARLNFHGFYTVVLEKEDIIVSVASIRVHGVMVAEMPLIATCRNYRRQGMCRHLISAIEEMLVSFKVEKLVISAIPDLVETWTVGFGFEPVGNDEKQCLKAINLMVFPGTVLLRKNLYGKKKVDKGSETGDAATSIKVHTCPAGEHLTEVMQEAIGSYCTDEVSMKKTGKFVESPVLQQSEVGGAKEAIHGIDKQGHSSPLAVKEFPQALVFSNGKPVEESLMPPDENFCQNQVVSRQEGKSLVVGTSQGSNLQEQSSKLPCGVSDTTVGRTKADVACNVLSVNHEPSLDRQPQQACEFNEK
uniref:N-acetyltransferase domain-containing protein n=1 Tax=Rhizophora mucronata TaxID=61149 RepID=A0A2P2PM58_RHIMU